MLASPCTMPAAFSQGERQVASQTLSQEPIPHPRYSSESPPHRRLALVERLQTSGYEAVAPAVSTTLSFWTKLSQPPMAALMAPALKAPTVRLIQAAATVWPNPRVRMGSLTNVLRPVRPPAFDRAAATRRTGHRLGFNHGRRRSSTSSPSRR